MTKVPLQFLMESAAALGGRANQRRVDKLRAMLDRCRYQFASYAKQHRAKKTPEADAEAAVNDYLAREIEALLAETSGPAVGPLED